MIWETGTVREVGHIWRPSPCKQSTHKPRGLYAGTLKAAGVHAKVNEPNKQVELWGNYAHNFVKKKNHEM